ncbi:S9 family peptidase [Kordiimonas aestuarii]|uniref:S9 family peptidase n=1 Tax=Kordiimonas aestuarii TaxID=1005925 RepID=UPI0021D0347A|nr:S9 family peptidase [Kordiimonas aestuarii]
MINVKNICTGVALIALTATVPVAAQDEEADASAPATMAASSHFQSSDVFELEYAASPAVSPDGKWVVYTRRSNDIMTDSTRSNLWVVSADGSDHRPLLSGTHAYYAPAWSPDGKRLAYLSNEEGKTQLFVRWMDTGQTALVTNLEYGPSSITWSPDGETIAFTMSIPEKDKPLKVKMPHKPKGAKWSPSVKYITKARYQADGRGILEPSYTHIFVVPALGGTARQISDGNYNHRGPLSFTPDSKEIIVSANRSDNWEYEGREADLYAFTLDGGMRQITSAPGAEFRPTVSPDGKLVAYLKMDDQKLAYRNDYLHVMQLDGSEDRTLSADIDNSLGAPKWDDKGKGLYYQMTVRGVDQVGYVSLSGKHQTVATGLGGTTLGRPYSSGDYDAAGGTVAFTRGTPQRPADLYVARGGKAMPRQLTALNEDALGHKNLAELHEIIYKSSIDGEEIQGWYLTPPGYEAGKKYPTILEIHGGPHASYGPHFSAEMQRFAAEGYVVFYDNHRGSTSYGERFALLLQNKYSSEYDFADHMSGVDALIEQGIADGEQLYITGGSAGGIASAYAIGLTDRFRAAAVAKPVINWISKVLTADSYLGQIPFQFPGMPWDNVEHYWKRSPLSLVGNVTTPTMLITGEADRRTPISETEQFYQALKLRKIDTIMVRVPGSPHGIAGKPSRLVAKVENILAWFDKYK